MTRALLLIDLQNDYFPGGRNPLHEADAAVSRARSLLDAFRRRGLPVVHVRHTMTSPAPPFFEPGTRGAEIHAAVAPSPGESVLEKHFPNAFLETGLLDLLQKAGVSDLVVAGMMTHMCVDASVRAAADHGFECALATDACATKDLQFGGSTVPAPLVHAAFLAALGSAYARVPTTDDLLREL